MHMNLLANLIENYFQTNNASAHMCIPQTEAHTQQSKVTSCRLRTSPSSPSSPVLPKSAFWRGC